MLNVLFATDLKYVWDMPKIISLNSTMVRPFRDEYQLEKLI